jgi:hypothetical protein
MVSLVGVQGGIEQLADEVLIRFGEGSRSSQERLGYPILMQSLF